MPNVTVKFGVQTRKQQTSHAGHCNQYSTASTAHTAGNRSPSSKPHLDAQVEEASHKQELNDSPTTFQEETDRFSPHSGHS